MEFCIETQTLKGILTAIYFVLTCEIFPAGAGQGEEDFPQKTQMCKFGVYRVLHWSPSIVHLIILLNAMQTMINGLCYRDSEYALDTCIQR